VRLHHNRDLKNHEVDIVLEDRAGDIVGIEVKSTTVAPGDFNGLHKLKELTGTRFKRGIVLYTGATAAPFADGLWALPVQFLWRSASRKAWKLVRRARWCLAQPGVGFNPQRPTFRVSAFKAALC